MIYRIELKLCTVVIIITKFHDMSTMTFPWQHNGLQARSIQMVKAEFPSFKKCYSVRVSEYGHYTEQVIYSFNDNVDKQQ